MKPNILTPVNLAEVVKSTDFLLKERLVHKDYLQEKVTEKYPFQPKMPGENPDYSKSGIEAPVKKFLQDLNFGDKELLVYAYKRNQAADRIERVESRIEEERETQFIADTEAINTESRNLQIRLYQAWIQRTHIAKMFLELKVKSMDEFKRLMRIAHNRTDIEANVQEHRMLKQHGRLPGSPPSPNQWFFEHDQKQDIARMSVEVDLKNHDFVSDMRLKMAEQHAALAFIAANPPIRKTGS